MRQPIRLWKIFLQPLMMTQTLKSHAVASARRTQVIARKATSAESTAVHQVSAKKAATMRVMKVMRRHADSSTTLCMTREESALGQKVTNTNLNQNFSISSPVIYIYICYCNIDTCCCIFTVGSGNLASYEGKKKKRGGKKLKAGRGKGKKETKEKKEKRLRKEQEKLDKEKEKEQRKAVKEQFNKGKKAQGACVFHCIYAICMLCRLFIWCILFYIYIYNYAWAGQMLFLPKSYNML